MAMTTPTVTVNGEQRAVAGVEPHVTALDWLRDQGLTGAKEGCAEGECGACSVLVARPDGAGRRAPGGRRSTPAWCRSLALDGQEVVTAEGLGRPGALHPVQREMAVRGGSQCGYCTPGFVCSMAAEYYRPDRAATDPATNGHAPDQRARPQRLRPARAQREPVPLHRLPADPRRRLRPRCTARGRRPGHALRVARAGGRVHPGAVGAGRVRPPGEPRRRAGAAGRAARRHGDRRLHRLGGRGQPPRHPRPVRRRRRPAARAAHVLRRATDVVEIGAALTLTEVERLLDGRVPLLDQLWPQFASRLIRNGATLGGNLGTGSPIGDAPPALLALEASVVLAGPARRARGAAGRRTSPATAETVREPGELIRAVRIPLPLAPLAAFHKIAKRRFDDISSVAVAFALDVRGRRRRAGPRSGSAASRPRRCGPPPPRPRSTGRPWTADTVARRGGGAAPARAPRSTTTGPAPPTARRCSARRLLKFARRDRDPQEVRGMSRAAHASGQPRRRRRRSRTRAPPCTSPASRSTPTTWSPAPRRAARLPGAGAARPRPGHGAADRAGARRARRRPGAHRRRRARASTTPASSTTSRCSRRGDVLRATPSAGCSARRSRRPGSAPLAVEVDYEPLPALVTVAEAIAAESFQGARPHAAARRRRRPRWAGCAHVFEGEFEFAGQEHFYLETHAALATVDENGQVFVQSVTQHPTETQEIVAHVLGLHEPRGHRAVPADGRRLRRQGDAAARLRGDRRARRHAHRAAGAAAAEPHAGHDDDRQAARVPRRRGGSASTTTGGSRRSTRRSPPTAAGASTCPSRCWPGRCATSTTPTGSRTSRCTAGSPRRNKTSQTAFRGFGGPQGMLVIEDILGRCAPALGIDARELRRRNFYRAGPDARRTGSRCATPSGSSGVWAQVARRPATSTGGWPRSRRSTPRTSTPSGRWRSRRSSSGSRSTSRRSTRPARWCTSTRTARC